MKSLLLCIFNALTFGIGQAYSQDTTRITVESGLQVCLDYGKLLTVLTDFETKWEAGLGYQFKVRVQINASYGMAAIESAQAIENGHYKAEGRYWRVGINYILPLDNTNSLYAGVKYAQSEFDDSGSYRISSDLWPAPESIFGRSGLEAQWFELIVGSEKVLRNRHILIGGKTGLRFMDSRSKESFIDIYTIPGYGLASDSSTPFLNLYIKYRF